MHFCTIGSQEFLSSSILLSKYGHFWLQKGKHDWGPDAQVQAWKRQFTNQSLTSERVGHSVYGSVKSNLTEVKPNSNAWS